MTGIALSLGTGLLGTAVFLALWLLAKADVAKLSGDLALKQKDFDDSQANLAALAKSAQDASDKEQKDLAARDQAIADLTKRCDAYRQLLNERATPEQVAERIAKLFPSTSAGATSGPANGTKA